MKASASLETSAFAANVTVTGRGTGALGGATARAGRDVSVECAAWTVVALSAVALTLAVSRVDVAATGAESVVENALVAEPETCRGTVPLEVVVLVELAVSRTVEPFRAGGVPAPASTSFDSRGSSCGLAAGAGFAPEPSVRIDVGEVRAVPSLAEPVAGRTDSGGEAGVERVVAAAGRSRSGVADTTRGIASGVPDSVAGSELAVVPGPDTVASEPCAAA
ncbi:MAG: hypothetical protein JJ896_12440 [Rhodothermales bacterium]|nr:hypothetical protein [Rhodothermales bacterium]MBO6780454.1 hypothetical protein [Rhodothermales bacterium]